MAEVLTEADNNAGRPDWLYDRTEVKLTVQDVANRLHQDIYGPESEHLGLHSCPCLLIARWNLGLEAKPNLYWPDGRGGNAHEPHPDPRVQLFRLKDQVIDAAKKWVGFYNGSSELFSDTKLAEKINALIEFESNQQQVKK